MIVKIHSDAHGKDHFQCGKLSATIAFTHRKETPSTANDNNHPFIFLGVLSATDFGVARSVMADLQSYADYNDWLDAREAFHIGLAMEGESVRVVPIEFERFAAWCRAARIRPTVTAFDTYAGITAENC